MNYSILKFADEYMDMHIYQLMEYFVMKAIAKIILMLHILMVYVNLTNGYRRNHGVSLQYTKVLGVYVPALP